MSRAFVKNDMADAEIVIPPRAPLPVGTLNYVTPRGWAMLKTELAKLEAERRRTQLDTDEVERARRLAMLAGRIAALQERISSARLVELAARRPKGVRFGATVTLRIKRGGGAGAECRLTIVGVDEADAAQGRVAFTSPIARAILGRGEGETTVLHTAQGDDELEIVAIDYE